MTRPSPQTILEAVANHSALVVSDLTGKRRDFWPEVARTAAVLLLDAAGWPRPSIACALERTIASVDNHLYGSYLRRNDHTKRLVGQVAAEIDIDLPATAAEAAVQL